MYLEYTIKLGIVWYHIFDVYNIPFEMISFKIKLDDFNLGKFH